jgi:hypothetical protein
MTKIMLAGRNTMIRYWSYKKFWEIEVHVLSQTNIQFVISSQTIINLQQFLPNYKKLAMYTFYPPKTKMPLK